MKDFYLGIDLGTTNSVVAYGNLAKSGNLKCNVLDLERKTENGGQAREKTLPSVVFYYKDPKTGKIIPEVGNYAKSRYGTKLGYVSKSVKSLMGIENTAFLADEIEDNTPSQVSAQILRYMLNHAKNRLMEDELKDVIITVPASFDSDQCQATLEAAELAGVNIDNIHDILLYEPKAVIYDFVNMQEAGEIPDGIIDFEKPKNILVFDLGGGTLDVTIHKVGYTNEDMMNIEDLAISRYTRIGGDDFDELIAKKMFERFQEQAYVKVPEKRKEEVMCKLRKMAERLKTEMSADYETAANMEKTLPEDYFKEVLEMNLFDSYSYIDEFTPEETIKIVSPLMGMNLTIQDVKRIDSLRESDMDNIIYPILDVLAKAGRECRIDAVILNGGMTRFFPIKKRIDDFFGLKALVTSDPDLAVARGAVYYHYCLHKYGVTKAPVFQKQVEESIQPENIFNTGTILNDNLNIGVAGEYVSILVEAGTKLPYVSPEISDKYSFGTNADSMSIEIFLGRRKTKNLPNRRIADRIIKFSKKYPANTPISFRIYIDNMRLMRMEAWITGKVDEKALISVDTNGQIVERQKTKASKINTSELLTLNPKGEINNLRIFVTGAKGNWKMKKKVTETIEKIGKASNKEDFYQPIMDIMSTLSQSETLRGSLYESSLILAEGWNLSQKKEVLKYCKEHFQSSYYGMQYNNYVMRMAIEYISRWDDRPGEFFQQILDMAKVIYLDQSIVDCIVSKTKSDIIC